MRQQEKSFDMAQMQRNLREQKLQALQMATSAPAPAAPPAKPEPMDVEAGIALASEVEQPKTIISKAAADEVDEA